MSIASEVNGVIKSRFHTFQTMSLSGIGHWHEGEEELCTLADKDVEECMGHDPLDLLERELHMALENVNYMKLHVDHTPFYDETGFCSVCGWDGNA